jgi:hypothetical protein
MYLCRPRRRRRSHEWSAGKTVTFIVTLAASGSVTLAARKAGMSRKSAYALKSRDPVFAAAWRAAVGASGRRSAAPAPRQNEGDSRTRAASSSGSTANRADTLASATEERDRMFAALAARLGRPAPANRLKQCQE